MRGESVSGRAVRLWVLASLVLAVWPVRPGQTQGKEAPAEAAKEAPAEAAKEAPAEAAKEAPAEAAKEAPAEAAPAAAEAEKPAEGGDKAAEEAPAKVFPKPEKVTVGVHINDIQSIDLKTHTYSMDAYFWFRWQNPEIDPATSMEFINPSELWGHTTTTNYEKPEEMPDGSLYQVVRVQGRFSKKMPLFNYPFDRQTLDIVFEDSVSEAGDMVYVLGTPAVTINPKLILPGYLLGQPVARVTDEAYPTNFGDPRNPDPSHYSRLHFELPVSRPAFAYGVKLLLPVFCVIICAALMFLFAPSYVDARVDVGITSMLTIVALQMTFNQDLPDVGYLMLMDKIYLCSYLFVIVGLAVVVKTTRMVDQGKADAGARLHRWVLTAVTVAYAGGTGLLVSQAIANG